MDRFISAESPPEGLDRELLEVLAEECAEVIQRVQKAQRFGLAEVQPGQALSNTDRIAAEVGDLMAVIERCIERGLLDENVIDSAIPKKKDKLRKFLQSVPI